MANPQGALGQVLAETLQNQTNIVIDNISNNIALFNVLKSRGNIKGESGGYVFREKLSYAQNDNTQWQSALSEFNTTPQDNVTYADFSQKILTSSVPFGDVELAQNSGKEQLINMVTAGVEALMVSLRNTMGLSVYSDGTNSLELAGLQQLISGTPTTGTVGGINRANYSFWRNQLYDFSVESVVPSATTIINAMATLYRRCLVQGGSEKPDLIIFDNTFYGYYENALVNIQRVTESKLAEAGFDALKYKSSDVVYDPNCPSSTGYFLNTKHIKLKYLNDALFKKAPETRPVNQLVTIYPYLTIANLTIDNCRTSGVMTL